MEFSYHLCVVGCWPACLYWSYQRSLILKCFLRCVTNLSAGCIQNAHMDFLSLQVCGRSWRGCWLGVQNFSLQWIDLPDLKSPSSSLLKHSLVDCWIVCIIFIGSELFILKVVLDFVCKFSVGCIQTRHMDFLPPQVCGGSCQGWRFLWFYLSSSIYWLDSSHNEL